jgi:hypothetical protein
VLLLLGFFLYFPESIFVFGKTKHEIEGGYMEERKEKRSIIKYGSDPKRL